MITININTSLKSLYSKKFLSIFLHSVTIAFSFVGAMYLNTVSLASLALSFSYTFAIWLCFGFAYLFIYGLKGDMFDKEKIKYCQGAILVCSSIGTFFFAFQTIDIFHVPVSVVRWNNYLSVMGPCIIAAGLLYGMIMLFSEWLVKKLKRKWL
jgi:hypothetical protein